MDLRPSRRSRRVLWPSPASRRHTCAAAREFSRDWLPGRRGSTGGPFRDLHFATFGWPVGVSPIGSAPLAHELSTFLGVCVWHFILAAAADRGIVTTPPAGDERLLPFRARLACRLAITRKPQELLRERRSIPFRGAAAEPKFVALGMGDLSRWPAASCPIARR
jgi:hypothetical protein